MLAALTMLAGPAAANQRRGGGKLLLTNGVSTVDGAAGGGLASWAVIAGNETEDGIGGTAHATYVALPDFDLSSAGAAIGLSDRIELSYAYQRFDTRAAGAALGLGRGFTFGQHIVGAKVKLVGDAVWAQDTMLPQVSAGVQYRIAERRAVVKAVGADGDKSADFYVAATKLWLAQGIVADATLRLTKANQFGLLGFGGPRQNDRTAQFEGSLAKMLTRKLVVGAEYRTKPDNLGFAEEDDSYDLFAAWAVHRNVSLTAAYVDLGDIATVRNQRGLFLSVQGGF
ncbi:DUF3034 family protein [Sphingomonas insulae]|uniref:DUF3034 family protein n=2 Tax=Sphingomonas insulae TaxID=424800 RepID=A0ABN1HW49_9SPHN|nr:DUF3034 family protein [Sphingomonas insulae]